MEILSFSWQKKLFEQQLSFPKIIRETMWVEQPGLIHLYDKELENPIQSLEKCIFCINKNKKSKHPAIGIMCPQIMNIMLGCVG